MEINNSEAVVDQTHYPYVNLESFWVETREAYPKIIFKSKKFFMPYISILIDDVNADQIREKLLQHLPEEEHIEPFLEKLLIYLGFW